FGHRLNQAPLLIRHVMQSPDIVGVVEMENAATLRSLAAKINSDTQAEGLPDPQYTAYLVEGNDIGGIDVGFLVKSTRVAVVDVVQEGKATTYVEPGGATATLNDRPPLILRGQIAAAGAAALAPVSITVIVNHLRSLSGSDDPADG